MANTNKLVTAVVAGAAARAEEARHKTGHYVGSLRQRSKKVESPA
jgi:hypothetical protein